MVLRALQPIENKSCPKPYNPSTYHTTPRGPGQTSANDTHRYQGTHTHSNTHTVQATARELERERDLKWGEGVGGGEGVGDLVHHSSFCADAPAAGECV